MGGPSEDTPPMLLPEDGPLEPLPKMADPDPDWEKSRRLNNPLLNDSLNAHTNTIDYREKNSDSSTQSSKQLLNGITLQIGQNKVRLKVVNDPVKAHIQNIMPSQMDECLGGGSEQYRCKTCHKPFNSRIALSKHEALHKNLKVFQCTFCSKTFSNRQGLTMHERIHTGEKPFQCPICTKSFARQTNYNIHMRLHASGRRYFCQTCGKWFRDESEMFNHQEACNLEGDDLLMSALSDKPLRYRCSFCDKMFHHRRDKHIHERTHTGERPYSCGYCGKGFTQSQALTIHIRTHTGERPYACTVCGQEFRGSSALRKHEFLRHNHNHLTNDLAHSFSGNMAPTTEDSHEPAPILSVHDNTFFV